MTEREAEIRARVEKATPEPWHPLLRSNGMTGVHSKECKIYHAPFDPECLAETHARQKADADFIAHARSDIPYLLTELQALREENERSTAMLKAQVLKAILDVQGDGEVNATFNAGVRAAAQAVVRVDFVAALSPTTKEGE